MGIATVAMILNEWRQQHGKSSVSYHAVQHYVKNTDLIDYKKRPTKKSGKTDPNSTWAKARLAQCQQMPAQYYLSLSPSTSPAHVTRGATAAAAAAESADSAWAPPTNSGRASSLPGSMRLQVIASSRMSSACHVSWRRSLGYWGVWYQTRTSAMVAAQSVLMGGVTARTSA